MADKKKKEKPSGMILYAKPSGITSFSSLWSIKKALNTDKVGHTGTLDSFAEGLLVTLSGNLTHLVSHITSFTKTYKAVVCFGKETDTLDPTGKIIKRGEAITKTSLESILKSFTGEILQVPPLYSALHVEGKRASDIVRSGKNIQLEGRKVFIYKNELLDFKEASENDRCSYALLEIVCSKGTYIRSLAKDMASSLGTCAHLCALRRTKVGPFDLKEAACFKDLKEFSIENGIKTSLFFQKEREKRESEIENDSSFFKGEKDDNLEKLKTIRDHFLLFTPDIAFSCGFNVGFLRAEAESLYFNGRPLSLNFFDFEEEKNKGNQVAIFSQDKNFVGLISKGHDAKLLYEFVVKPSQKDFRVFSWEDFCSSSFPIEWKAKGLSLTVGSYEAVHSGHIEIIKSIVEKKDFVPGVLTFSSSIKDSSGKSILTLDQRLSLFKSLGLAFAVVIDFTPDFSKIEGESFIDILVSCGMRFLCEGEDFKCGYKGSIGTKELMEFSVKKGFDFCLKDSVFFEDEKISSSRIRKKIIEGDLASTEKMMSRHFSLDVKGVSWEEKDSFFEAKNEKNQVLPPDGKYKVEAIKKDKSVKGALLKIESEKLFLEFPKDTIKEKLTQEISFLRFL